MKQEEKLTLNLRIPQIILQKETYKILAGENENRVRIYLGLEPVRGKEKLTLCAYAVSAFLLGSGDVYVDYETPVFKLENQNIDFSGNTAQVIESIKRYRSWRAGNLDPENETAAVRQYIYPNGVFNEIISVILVKLGSKNTLFLNHIYTIVSFVLLSLFFGRF